MLQVADNSGFDFMVTADQGIQFQQNIKSRKLAIVVLSSNVREIVITHIEEIVAAINSSKAGSLLMVDFIS